MEEPPVEEEYTEAEETEAELEDFLDMTEEVEAAPPEPKKWAIEIFEAGQRRIEEVDLPEQEAAASSSTGEPTTASAWLKNLLGSH